MPPFPWQANTTTYKNQTSPTRTFGNAEIKSAIVSQNSTVVVINTTSAAAWLLDTFRFADDVITVTTQVTSRIPPTECAGGAAVIYFGSHFGNIQLGTSKNRLQAYTTRHSCKWNAAGINFTASVLRLWCSADGCKCSAVLMSGTGSADGHGQANNCTADCKSGNRFILGKLTVQTVQLPPHYRLPTAPGSRTFIDNVNLFGVGQVCFT